MARWIPLAYCDGRLAAQGSGPNEQRSCFAMYSLGIRGGTLLLRRHRVGSSGGGKQAAQVVSYDLRLAHAREKYAEAPRRHGCQ